MQITLGSLLVGSRLIIVFILLEHRSCNVYVLQIVRILSGAMTTLSAVDPLSQRIMFVTSCLASWTDSTYGEQALSSLARTTTSTLGRLWCLASSHRYEPREGGDLALCACVSVRSSQCFQFLIHQLTFIIETC